MTICRFTARNCRLGAVIAVLCLVPRVSDAMFPSDTFDSDNEGWAVVGSNTDYGPPAGPGIAAGWDDRGNPGGALSIGDYYYSTWLSAPAAFVGNQSDMYGKSFSYDLYIRYSDTTSFPYPSAAIVGNNLNLVYTIATPPLFTWDRRVVTFDPALWRVDVGAGAPQPGRVPTAAEMQSVLSGLTALYLLTEWRTGPDDTSVDNVGLGFNTGLIGDYNHNGFVDAADYTVFRDKLGSVYTQTDYDIWRAHFGEHNGSGANTGILVPESTSWLLMCLAVAAIVLRQWTVGFRPLSASIQPVLILEPGRHVLLRDVADVL
jgi:Laminin B (Domain IV)